MNWPLKSRAENATPELDGPLPSWMDQWVGRAKDYYMGSDSWRWREAIQGGVHEDMYRALNGKDFTSDRGEVGEAIKNMPAIGGAPLMDAGSVRRARSAADMDAMFEQVRIGRQFDPDTFGGLPASREEFEAEINRRHEKEIADNEAMLARGDSFMAQFLGGMTGALTDEWSAPFLGIGSSAKSLARAMLAEGGINAALEVPQVIKQRRVAEDLGREAPNAALQIGEAFVYGAGFAAVLGGGARALDYVLGRRQGEAAALAAENAGLDGQMAVDAAEAAMRRGEVPVAPPVARGLLPAITSDAPANWEAIRGGIFAGESGGDYNALFGYSNRQGGPFAHVKLTEMTVDEAIAFSDPSGPYAQWVKAQIGRVATPMGGYQIVGKTLRAAKQALRLRGDEVMTAELQEKLGQWIYRAQGTGAWEGYRGPSAGFVPTEPVEYRGPAATPPGRRPFTTRFNEVTTPAGTRVEVRYRVVDLDDLKAASGDLQPRDRTRAASDLQVTEMAARLDPARLMPGPESDRGAPIVGPDMIVESGNGRVMALSRAASENPRAYEAYLGMIGEEFDIPEGVRKPVLIAERVTDLDAATRRSFIRESNVSSIGRMAPSEQARLDADYLSPRSFDAYQPGKGLNAPENAGFVRQMLATMPQNERAALLTGDGRLNIDGIRRLRQALFARAFEADDLLKMVAETESPAVENLLRMLEDLAPDWAAFRTMVEAGYVRVEFDITDQLMEAVRIIARARLDRRDGQSVIGAIRDRLAQDDMFGSRDPMIEALLDVFYKGDRARPPEASGEILRRYAAEATIVGRADIDDLMGDAVTPVQALARAVDGHDGRTPYNPARMPDPDPEPPVAPLGDISKIDPSRFDDGASSPSVERANDALNADLRAAAAQADLIALVERGGSADEIATHPAVRDVLSQANARPRTDSLPDYGSEAFWSAREYRDGEEILLGRRAATDYLYRKARSLAWTDDGLAPPETIRSERRAVILLGAPAAGKSSIANPYARSLGAAIVDADEAKKIIPEFDGGIGANAVHEESSELIGDVLEAAALGGDNLVLPKVGGRAASIERQVSGLKSLGYQVDLVLVDLPPDAAWRRMIGRFVATGRIIPPEVMQRGIDGAPLTYDLLKQKGIADAYAKIDNTPGPDQPRGVIEDDGGILPEELVSQSSDVGRDGGHRGASHARVSRAGEGEAGRGGESGRVTPQTIPQPSTAPEDPAAAFSRGADLTSRLEDEADAAALTLWKTRDRWVGRDAEEFSLTGTEDGPRATVSEVLDDLDQDQALMTAMSSCMLKGVPR
jgi:hypothetical protein